MAEDFSRFNFPQFATNDFIVEEQTKGRIEILEKFINGEEIENKNKKISKKRWCLYIWGNPGMGKTHFAIHGMKIFVKKISPWALFFPFHSFIRKLKMSFDNAAQMNTLIDNVMNCDLLFFDDIGAGKLSDYPLQMFQEIIDERYNNFKRTIITSNLNTNDFEKEFGPRLASRVFESGQSLFYGETSYNRLTC